MQVWSIMPQIKYRIFVFFCSNITLIRKEIVMWELWATCKEFKLVQFLLPILKTIVVEFYINFKIVQSVKNLLP